MPSNIVQGATLTALPPFSTRACRVIIFLEFLGNLPTRLKSQLGGPSKILDLLMIGPPHVSYITILSNGIAFCAGNSNLTSLCSSVHRSHQHFLSAHFMTNQESSRTTAEEWEKRTEKLNFTHPSFMEFLQFWTCASEMLTLSLNIEGNNMIDRHLLHFKVTSWWTSG